MSCYEEGTGTARRSRASLPEAMFGFKSGEAWVADDAFVTRDVHGDLLVERWDLQGVRFAVVRRDSEGFMRAMWVKLNDVAVDGIPESAL